MPDLTTWIRARFHEGKEPVLTVRVQQEAYTAIEVTVKLKDEPDIVGLGWTLDVAFNRAVQRRK